MKKIYISLCLMMVSVVGFGQWFQLVSGTTLHLWSVHFTNANTGYGVGYNGTILKTTNGGTNWFSQTSGTTNSLKSVFFTDVNTGYAAGEYGTLVKTTNGGTSWNTLSTGTTYHLSGIHFPSANTGYVVGADYIAGMPRGIVIKTTDNGLNWATVLNTSGYFLSVFFTDVNTGYVGCLHSVIHKTTNGGVNWAVCYTASPVLQTQSIYFVNANTGYAAGGHAGQIVKTTNGGLNWVGLYFHNLEWLFSIYFIDSNTGYCVGQNISTNQSVIMKTTNAGTNWSAQTSGTNWQLFSVFFTDANTGYAVGANGTILKTTNGGVGFNEIKKSENIIVNIYPNPVSNELIIEIEGSKEETSFEILNSIGQVVFKGKLLEKTVINTAEFSAGVYIIKFENGRVCEFRKMVKE